MKLNRFSILVILSAILMISLAVQASEENSIYISITQNSFGRVHGVWVISDKEIIVNQNSNHDFRRPKTVLKVIEKKILSSTEQDQLNTLLKSIPFKQLKRGYYSGMKDGVQHTFAIKWGNLSRTIQVSNYYQKDLGSLVRFVNSRIRNKIYYKEID